MIFLDFYVVTSWKKLPKWPNFVKMIAFGLNFATFKKLSSSKED